MNTELAKMLSVKQVSEIVGLSVPTIYRMVNDGRFPPGHLIAERSRRWRSDDVAEWLDFKTATASGCDAFGSPWGDAEKVPRNA